MARRRLIDRRVRHPINMRKSASVRILSNVLLTLALVVAGLAIWLYLWAFGMACAYTTGAGGCTIRPPWRLGYEDFLFLVAIPWGLVLLLAIGTVACRRAARRNAAGAGVPAEPA
jgi:hypothetical protein